MPIALRCNVRVLGTSLRECLTCCSYLEKAGFTDFCYAHYKVTGDGVERSQPRHTNTICRSCLQGYCSTEVNDGKLFVKCPLCPRHLQLRELDDRRLVSKPEYEKLMVRIRETEENNDFDMSQFYADGITILLCPRCVAPIEKNGGCSTIHCWRCGNQFKEDKARKVKKRKREVNPDEELLEKAKNIGEVYKERELLSKISETHPTKKKTLSHRYLSKEENETMSKKEKDTILKKREKKVDEKNKKADIRLVCEHTNIAPPKVRHALRVTEYDIVEAIVELTCTKREKNIENRAESRLRIAKELIQPKK